MQIGRYLPLNSVIHRIDPRAKLISMVALMTALFIGGNFFSLGVIGVFTLVLIKMSKLGIFKTIKALKFMWIMFIFLTLMNIIFIKGDAAPLFTIPWLNIAVHEEALYRTAFVILRIAVMISFATILTTTTKPLDLTMALEWLLHPLTWIKLPVHIFSMMTSIALRFIPRLMDETDKIMKAQASRGLDVTNGKFRDKIRGLIALIIPLLVISFHIAADLADAMEVRGYDPSAKRTRYRVLKAKFKDYFAITLVAGITTFVFLVNFNVFALPFAWW